MKLPVIAVAVIAATIAVTFDFGEAFGVTSPLAIVFPLEGDGSVAIVCGILATVIPRNIQCLPIPAFGSAGVPFDIYPNVTFVSISSGRDTMCGLQSGGTNIFCWKHARSNRSSGITSHVLQDTYQNHVDVALRDLVVGEEQISAADENDTFIGWWRNDPSYPSKISGRFRSLTSGRGFFCAIDDQDKVVCWGPEAQNIYPAFEGEEMSTIVSGENHACGITKDGRVICGGNNGHGQCDPPSSAEPFDFVSLALGSTHTCGSRTWKYYNTVVCWGAGVGVYSPMNGDESFTYLVASGSLTCGVRTESTNVFCWWTIPGSTPAKHGQLPLSREVVYGICVPPSSCPCYFAGSATSCADSNVICERCT